jgi:hypothetical protein
VTEVGQQRRGVRLEAVGQEDGHRAGGHHLGDLMDDALLHGQRAIPDVDGQQQLGHRVGRYPHPVRQTRQALDHLGLADLTILDRIEQGIELVELHLGDPHVVQKILREGLEMLCCLHQPP